VLVELSVMEQRYQAVLAVIQDGWKVVEVADPLGVSRQAVHAWIAPTKQAGWQPSPTVSTGRPLVFTRSLRRWRR
jgi:transposase